MSSRLIIDGNAVYEIDEECMANQECRQGKLRSCSSAQGQKRRKETGRTKDKEQK